jgi:hypothetical protein
MRVCVLEQEWRGSIHPDINSATDAALLYARHADVRKRCMSLLPGAVALLFACLKTERSTDCATLCLCRGAKRHTQTTEGVEWNG